MIHSLRSALILVALLFIESTAGKKYCWYVDAGYPTYFICRAYEDCCGTRCCMRAFSIQRLWYFWFLLMMGVLFCCGAGFFIRRRMHPPRMIDDPPFSVGFTRHPVNTTGCQTTGGPQVGMQYYPEPGPPLHPIGTTFQIQPNAPLLNPAYPPPPAYCNQPPPPYEQVVKTSNKDAEK